MRVRNRSRPRRSRRCRLPARASPRGRQVDPVPGRRVGVDHDPQHRRSECEVRRQGTVRLDRHRIVSHREERGQHREQRIARARFAPRCRPETQRHESSSRGPGRRHWRRTPAPVRRRADAQARFATARRPGSDSEPARQPPQQPQPPPSMRAAAATRCCSASTIRRHRLAALPACIRNPRRATHARTSTQRDQEDAVAFCIGGKRIGG